MSTCQPKQVFAYSNINLFKQAYKAIAIKCIYNEAIIKYHSYYFCVANNYLMIYFLATIYKMMSVQIHSVNIRIYFIIIHLHIHTYIFKYKYIHMYKFLNNMLPLTLISLCY